MNAEQPGDVHRALMDYVKRADDYKEQGQQGCAWHQRNVVDRPVRAILDLLEEDRS